MISYLNQVPLAGLMLVVAGGYLLGRTGWRGVSLGPAGGTVALALVLGYAGLDLHRLYGADTPPLTVGLFGFSLFIYSVGFEAGPRFASNLRTRAGLQHVAIALLVNAIAVSIAVGASRLLRLDPSTTAGLLSGALTSAPAFAAASEIAPDPARLSVSFALTYPVGLVGVLLAVQLLPRLMGDRFATEEGLVELEEDTVRHRRLAPEHGTPELTRPFRVERHGVIGRPLRELDLTHRTGCVISRIRRGDRVRLPDADTVLERGDHILATGRVDELERLQRTVGPEIYDDLLGTQLPSRRIQVTRLGVAGKTLAQLDLIRRHHVVVSCIESGDVLYEPTAEAVVHRDDVVEAVGEPDDLRRVAEELGRFEPPSSHTNIAIYAGGILLGVLLGSVELHPIGLDFSLGRAGGLLLVGVVLGHVRRLGPFSANVPRPARQLVRDLGILLFVTEAGVQAGARLHGETAISIWQPLVAGAVVMAASVLLGVLVGRYVLRMQPVDVWGSVSGGMTSSAALVILRRASSANPAVSYAAAYAVASVLVTIAGQVVVLLTSS